MIEETVREYLLSELECDVYMQRPDNPPKRYVIIEKTGGGEDEHIYRATFAIQSYADSLYEASLLNENVKSAMRAITRIDSISKCALNTDYNYTDTRTNEYRYQAVYNLVHF